MPRQPWRKIALAEGYITYFSDKPCKRGHMAERYTSNCVCMACNTEVHQPKYRQGNPEKLAARNKSYREKNINHCRERDRIYVAKIRSEKRKEKEI